MTSTALVVLIILAYFKHSPPVVSVSVPGSEDWFLVRPLDLFIPANGDMQRFLRFTLPAQIRSLLSDPVALLRPAAIGCIRMYPGDELGRGAGKGGGKGGKIRDAGGSFGKRQAGQEEEYFYRKFLFYRTRRNFLQFADFSSVGRWTAHICTLVQMEISLLR
ncbi:unnamed protein product [Calicophoron daubneyi]|uniref:Uncharacterized protein n=1 Tax=Calicophoron daubneyi TaxID=300641 RepID=A0AAV2T8Z5_CALDB